ncbi:MAG TPA: response regulator transcription factor [Treponemataceae bacterium]|nr:response regulator transcription factor [Treponemataceae bacterium]
MTENGANAVKKQKSVVLVDDHQMIREGLRVLIQNNSVAEVAGEAGSAAEAIALLDSMEEAPSAVIVDISLPDMNGIALVRQLRHAYPEVAFIMYTMHVSVEYVQSALEAGATGYVSKSSPSRELLNALDFVWKGTPYLDSLTLKMTIARTMHHPEEVLSCRDKVREELTGQENRVYRLMLRNFSNSKIAEELDLREKTVQNYVSTIYQKLQVRNRFELLDLANRA